MSPLLEIRNLGVHYVTARGARVNRAVDEVSFSLDAGETLGIVGESGSGKTTLALSLLRLLPTAARFVSGEVRFEGRDLLALSDKEMRKVRGQRIAMILQDPLASLNPLFTIGNQVAEPLRVHEHASRKSAWARARELLRSVKIPAPEARVKEYPHQMSGGMRQRIVGAIGISCEPRLLIADEPTTSLDLTIQAQYLNLLRELQRAHGLALIFITHNLGIVAKMCDRVAVMYAGRMVEAGPVKEIFDAPAHPYTRALLESIPRMSDSRRRLTAIEGQPPDLAALPAGCAFHPRCPEVMDRCHEEAPPDITVSPGPLRPLLACRARRAREEGVSTPVVEARRLSKLFPVKGGFLGRSTGVVRAVDDISFIIDQGQTLGLVGESGCGKTTTSKLVLGLEEPTGGSIRFEGKDLQELDAAGRRHYRKSVQAVFQDPFASLNPRMRVGAIIAEPLVTNESLPDADVRKRVAQLLELTGLPERAADALPPRVLRRPAPAHRHRPRAGAVPAPGGAGRAGLRAGRLDPRADPQPPARSPGPARALLPLHRPRPRRGGPHEPHHRGDVPRPAGRDGRGGRAEPRPASIPTRRRSSRPRCPRIPTSGARRSSCPARCRARCARRPAAASTRAVPQVMAHCSTEEPQLRPLEGRVVACHLFN